MAERRAALRQGPGRVLVFFYGLLAVAATGRSGYQIIAIFDEAPLAYLLSALAAVIYVVAFVALLRDARRLAFVACTVEFVGVVTVGTLSVFAPDDFPQETVWSLYGIGYAFLPLVLPLLALWWLRKAPR